MEYFVEEIEEATMDFDPQNKIDFEDWNEESLRINELTITYALRK